MPKGYKIPKLAAPRETMRMGLPKKKELLSPASSGMPSIPSIRPTAMRNLTPWKGFKPGKY